MHDAILIPGGGVRPGGVLPSWVRARFDRAIELHRGEYLIALSASTTHRPPPLDDRGFPILEASAGAQYLIAAGADPAKILTESQSYDTIGNAFFSRVIHADPLRLRRLLVITSDFHLERTRAAFQWVYGLEPSPVTYELEFEGVADAEMSDELRRQRVNKERRSLAALAPLAERIRTFPALHHWLFTEHGAYRASRSGFGETAVDPQTLDSY